MVRWACALAVALILALSFQGSRGLWEPGEGFYAIAPGAQSPAQVRR